MTNEKRPPGSNAKFRTALVGAVFVIGMISISLLVPGSQPLILIATVIGTLILVITGLYLDRRDRK